MEREGTRRGVGRMKRGMGKYRMILEIREKQKQ